MSDRAGIPVYGRAIGGQEWSGFHHAAAIYALMAMVAPSLRLDVSAVDAHYNFLVVGRKLTGTGKCVRHTAQQSWWRTLIQPVTGGQSASHFPAPESVA